MALSAPGHCVESLKIARISRILTRKGQQQWQLRHGVLLSSPPHLRGRGTGSRTACSSLTASSALLNLADLHSWTALVVTSATGHVSAAEKHTFCSQSATMISPLIATDRPLPHAPSASKGHSIHAKVHSLPIM